MGRRPPGRIRCGKAAGWRLSIFDFDFDGFPDFGITRQVIQPCPGLDDVSLDQ